MKYLRYSPVIIVRLVSIENIASNAVYRPVMSSIKEYSGT